MKSNFHIKSFNTTTKTFETKSHIKNHQIDIQKQTRSKSLTNLQNTYMTIKFNQLKNLTRSKSILRSRNLSQKSDFSIPFSCSQFTNEDLKTAGKIMEDKVPFIHDEIFKKQDMHANIQTHQKYFNQYKNLDKQLQKNEVFFSIFHKLFLIHFKFKYLIQMYQIDPSPITLIHENFEKNQILPVKKGIFYDQPKNKGKIQLQHMKYGDKYMNSLQPGINFLDNIHSIRLDDNRMTPRSAINIIKHLQTDIKELNLSHNNLGIEGLGALAKFLKNPYCKLQKLDLEEVQLKDSEFKTIAQGISENETLCYLNISKNLITDAIMDILCETLDNHLYIQELYLHWNKFSGKIYILGKSSSRLFNYLAQDTKIRVLDLSWNDLGLGLDIRAIQDFFGTNTTMRHLDLSYNKVRKKDAKLIKNALNHNQSLFGFHFMGNYGYTNAAGFLVLQDTTDDGQPPIIHRIQGISANRLSINKRWQYQHVFEHCWLCDGWGEASFDWDGQEKPVYIHYEFENYEGKYLGPKNVQQRVIPPQEFKYFYTIHDSQKIKEENQKRINLNQLVRIQDTEHKIDMEFLNLKLKQYIGYFQIFRNLLNSEYNMVGTIRPRIQQIWYSGNYTSEAKEWNIRKSIFNEWGFLTKVRKLECFAQDWDATRMSNVIKNMIDLQEVREFLKNHFEDYLYLYKYYSALQPINEIFCVTTNPLMKLMNKTQMFEKNFTHDDFQIKLISTLVQLSHQKNQWNPEKGLVRHEFMEFLVRVADQKYFKSGICNTHIDALHLLFKHNLSIELQKKEKYDSNIWREQVYWNQNCEIVLEKNHDKLVQVYKLYSTARLEAGRPYMKLSMFLSFCNKMQILGFDTQLYELDLTLIFQHSKAIEFDDLKTGNAQKMTYIEFVEAISRIADRISPIGKNEDEQMSWEIRKSRPLEQKIAIFIQMMNETILEDTQNVAGLRRQSVNNFSQRIQAIQKMKRMVDQIRNYKQTNRDIKRMGELRDEALEQLDY